jgi:hypothetical protein
MFEHGEVRSGAALLILRHLDRTVPAGRGPLIGPHELEAHTAAEHPDRVAALAGATRDSIYI